MRTSKIQVLGIAAFFVLMAAGMVMSPENGDKKEISSVSSKMDMIASAEAGMASPQTGQPPSVIKPEIPPAAAQMAEGQSNPADGMGGNPSVPGLTGDQPGEGAVMGDQTGEGGMMGDQPGRCGMMGGHPGRCGMMGGPSGPGGMMGGPSGPGGMMGGPGGMMGGPAGPNNPAARQQAAGAMERPHGKMHGGHGSMMNHSQGMAPGSMEGQRKGMCCSQGMNGDSRDFTRLTTDTEAVERFLYDQRQRINITSAQEKAWNNFSQSVMNQITTRINVTNIMRKAATENPMDRVEQHLTAMEALMKQRRALFEDFRTLHEQLSNTQKPMAEQLYSNTSD